MIRISETAVQDDLVDMEVSPNGTVENVDNSISQAVPPKVWASEREMEMEKEKPEAEARLQRKQQGGYECKYCPFSTQNLSDFKEHVDSNHPNVILNPLYLCAVCNFNTKKFDTLTEHNDKCHPGENNFKFKRIKLNSQTILEQTIEGVNSAVTHDAGAVPGSEGFATFPLSKSTTVKIGKPKMDSKQIFHKGENHVDALITKDQITAVNVNGTVIFPEVTVKEGLSHVMPLLQRPPNFNLVPKIAVPLNTTKYNPSLDTNATLITSFNKFPYPTHAELSWLTAASKHPEEQIKVWFTTQRLKQGITWSPEEVEEARKKMFNGSIPPVHQTFTVLPTPLTQPAKVTQPLIQTVPCQLVGQSGLVLTTVANGSTVTCPPVALTVANNDQTFKRPLPAPPLNTEGKRSMAAPKLAPALVPTGKRPTAALATALDMKRPMSGAVLASEGKRSMATPTMPAEMKRPMGPPLAVPEMKRPLVVPVVVPEMKRPRGPPSVPPTVTHEMKRPISAPVIGSDGKWPTAAPELKQTITTPVMSSEVKRPTIIKSVQPSIKAASPIPNFSLDCKKSRDHITELQTCHLKSQFPDDKEAHRLIETSGVSQVSMNNSFSDNQYRNHKAVPHLGIDLLPKDMLKKPIPTQFPLLERVKGKTSEQLKILEDSFQRSSFPTLGEIDGLVTETRLSKNEINSWFSERRALRDNLEQALLNSMGSKKAHVEERQQQWQSMQNGIYELEGQTRNSPIPLVAPSSCSAPIDGKSLGHLKSVFAQTRWPSPEEYNHLEIQTGLARTDIVRWFKDNRLALKSGNLEWMEVFQKLNDKGQNGLESPVSTDYVQNAAKLHYQDGKAQKEKDVKRLSEAATLSSQEIKDLFASKLGHSMSDGKNGIKDGRAREDQGGWVKMTVGVDGGLGGQELVSDTDSVAEETPGRVTG
ncbi:hypothetical protein JZ751_000586 [Albula glossodonta]|uniref:Homeobox domain-containing protein n=1 Tax=Albula glossodonta TaxID=121402 RepID=A0A8T2PWU1_9TELE|nr:hypothetical protein JZ751_000586 [Albula glossodonta]